MTGTRQGHNAKHEHLPKNRLSVLSAQNEEENSKCVGAGMEACCQQEGSCHVNGDLTVGKAIGEDALAAVGVKESASLVLSYRLGYRGIKFSSPLAWIGFHIIVIPAHYNAMKRLRRKGEGDWSTS